MKTQMVSCVKTVVLLTGTRVYKSRAKNDAEEIFLPFQHSIIDKFLKWSEDCLIKRSTFIQDIDILQYEPIRK